MAVGKRDIEIIKGDDFTHIVRLTVRSGSTFVPIDITGRTYASQMKETASQVSPTATFVCVVTDAPNGEITLSMDHDTTDDLVSGCYVWDLQQNASGVIKTILGGKANVLIAVTS